MPLESRDWSDPFNWLGTVLLKNKEMSNLAAAYNRFHVELDHLRLIWERLEVETLTYENNINIIMKRAKEGTSANIDEIIKQFFLDSRFLYLDLEDFVIHSRILMDRIGVLVAHLIEGPARCLQHASFHDHRRFFLDPNNVPYKLDEEYALYIREHTSWFENMLRDARDILIVHDSSLQGTGLLSGPKMAPRRIKSQLNWGSKQQKAYERLLRLRDKYSKTIGEPLCNENNVWELLDLFEKYANALAPDDLKTITEIKRKIGGKLPDVNILSNYILEYIKFSSSHFQKRHLR
jgi:hypothetical protein